MDTNLPSLNRYYSLNRNRNINNLDIVNHNNRNNFYCTMSHRGNHLGNNVRLILPPTPPTSNGQIQEMVNLSSNSSGQESKNVSNYEGHYNNVSSTSDYNTISVSDESTTDHQTLIKPPGLEVRAKLGLERVARVVRMVVFILAILSPIAMIALPKMELLGLKHSQLKCGVGCEGLKISIIFRLVLLVLCWWGVQLRSPVTSPRPDLARAAVSGLSVLLLSIYWGLYLAQLRPDNRGSLQYEAVVDNAGGLVTALLSLHYLSVLVTIIRPRLSPGLALHMVRAEDGHSIHMDLGQVSIQVAESSIKVNY